MFLVNCVVKKTMDESVQLGNGFEQIVSDFRGRKILGEKNILVPKKYIESQNFFIN